VKRRRLQEASVPELKGEAKGAAQDFAKGAEKRASLETKARFL